MIHGNIYLWEKTGAIQLHDALRAYARRQLVSQALAAHVGNRRQYADRRTRHGGRTKAATVESSAPHFAWAARARPITGVAATVRQNLSPQFVIALGGQAMLRLWTAVRRTR